MMTRLALTALSGLILLTSFAASADAGCRYSGYSGYRGKSCGVRPISRGYKVHRKVHRIEVPPPPTACYVIEYHLHCGKSFKTTCYQTAITAAHRLERLGCDVSVKKDCHCYYVCYDLRGCERQTFDCKHEAHSFAGQLERLGFHAEIGHDPHFADHAHDAGFDVPVIGG